MVLKVQFNRLKAKEEATVTGEYDNRWRSTTMAISEYDDGR